MSESVACFSGGKDSTAMILAMLECGETIDRLLVTPTGNELPEVWEHWLRIADLAGAPVIRPKGPTLVELIEGYNALPNFRQRWCTRQIKIQPAIAWAMRNPTATLCVGLRFDEEERVGIISTSVKTRFPLREYEMGIDDVRAILAKHDVRVPFRTDCALCYHQRIGEWFELWRDHPDQWEKGEEWERRTEHTFRSPGRDSWPVSMAGMGEAFESGKVPSRSLKMLERDREGGCRVCSL